MRLWSINPEYLDSIGLVAVWREALLAKKVLEEKTKGYKNHPQLERFKNYSKNNNKINKKEFNNKKEISGQKKINNQKEFNNKEYSKKESIKLIDTYLYFVFLESKKRGFVFDGAKCKNHNLKKVIPITDGQIDFEFRHLQKKLFKRNRKKFLENKKQILSKKKISSNELFKIVKGQIETWEKT